MDKKQAEKRIKELRKTVEYHAKKYYDEDKPEITDFEYDMMMLELITLESQYPELITKTSLTQRVGGTVKEGFQKVEHEVPLQSLQDVFNFEENKLSDSERIVKTNLFFDKFLSPFIAKAMTVQGLKELEIEGLFILPSIKIEMEKILKVKS